MTRSILIVDDNHSLANLYHIVFERNDWLVERVSSGQEALDRLARKSRDVVGAPDVVGTPVVVGTPDVVLLDLMMPDVDGIEVCRRIREQYPQAPPCIAVYTAINRPEAREDSLAAGADLFFSKNLSVFELPEKIAAHLQPPIAP